MPREVICGIYKITSPSGRIYIGQSANCLYRQTFYKWLGCKKQPKLYNSIKKYGWDLHIFEIILKCKEHELDYWEDYYINLFQTLNTDHGLNLKGGGANGRISEESKQRNRMSQLGKRHTLDTRRKQSERAKGRIFTDEHKQNLSKAKTGLRHSLEVIQKMRESRKGEGSYWFGKHVSEESKKKNSIAHLGEKGPMFGRFGDKHPSFGRGTVVLNVETGIFYMTIREASKTIGMNWDTLRKKLKGTYKNNTKFIYA